MVFSVATALIPFLQNDDANRALMGSNMQRQAVPLLTTEAPVVGTGIEAKAAVDSGVCVVAKKSGTILRSCSKEIIMQNDDGTKDTYRLTKFMRSNQSNCYNQRPIVYKGDHVEMCIRDRAGTVTMDVAKAVADIKAGKIEYRLVKTNIVHVPIGKASFTEEQLADNFQTLIDAINKAKPAAVKGQYLRSVTIAPTMGPGVKINPVKLV